MPIYCAGRQRLEALLNNALPLIARTYQATGVGSPAATLGRLLDFFETIARRSAYLSLLTEYPHTQERVIRMMHASGWATMFLSQHPILLDELLVGRERQIDLLRGFTMCSCFACWRRTSPAS